MDDPEDGNGGEGIDNGNVLDVISPQGGVSTTQDPTMEGDENVNNANGNGNGNQSNKDVKMFHGSKLHSNFSSGNEVVLGNWIR